MSDMIQDIFSLKKKLIVITGAAGLLGQEHAISISAFKGIPILLDLNEAKLKALSKRIKENFNLEAPYFKVDITSEAEVRDLSKKIQNEIGAVDGLINNAANNPRLEVSNKNFSRLENFPLDQWHQDLSVGRTGSFLCSKYIGQSISQNENGGVILNISSDLGLIAPDQSLYSIDNLTQEEQPVKPVSYSVVKTGIIGLTRYLSTYWPDQNVRCNALCPGGVKNNQSSEFISRVIKKIPLSRLANPNDYHGAVVWMMSDAASYLNGAVIAVDGGRSVW